ncbi:MAG: histidine kinase N-terminal 7TM domain-containing protein [Thermoplasmatota archaeon]
MIGNSLLFAAPSILALVISLYLLWLLGIKLKRSIISSAGILTFPVMLWSLFYALELLSTGLEAKVALEQLTFIGKTTIVPVVLIFAWRFSGKDPKYEKYTPLLFIQPVLIMAFVITNDIHQLFWTDVRLIENSGVHLLVLEKGPLFYFHVAYTYLFLCIGMSIIFREIVRRKGSNNTYKAVLISAFILPLLSDSVYILGLIPIEGFSLTTFSFAIGMTIVVRDALRSRIIDRSPIVMRTLFTSMTDGAVIFDHDRRIIDVNPSAEEMFGISLEEARGRKLEEALPEIRDTIIRLRRLRWKVKVVKLILKGKIRHFELKRSRLRSEDGGTIGYLLQVRDITDERKDKVALENARKELEGRVHARTAELEETAKRLEEEVLDRKKAQETADSERRRAEFYLDLLSHDIANIHQGLQLGIQMMEMNPDQSRNRKYRSMMGSLLTKAIKLASNVKILSNIKKSKPILVQLDLEKVINESVRSVVQSFPDKEIAIDRKVCSERIHVLCGELVGEVFYNLFHNSVKYQGSDNPWMRIGIGKDEKRRMAVIDIEDGGPGIKPEMKEIIFDRVQMSEEMRHSGIGLSLVKELVERYQGSIEVHDRIRGDPSQGTRVRVRLPIA